MHFISGKVTIFTYLEIPQPKAAKPDPYQVNNLTIDRLKHPSYLPWSPLCDSQSDLEPTSIPACEGRSGGAAGAVVQLDSPPQDIQCVFRYFTLNCCFICTGNLIAGVGKTIGPFAVVGKKQQPETVKIETAHRIEPLRDFLQEVSHHGSPLRVVKGGNIGKGFVEHDINPLQRGLKLFSIDANAILPISYPEPELRNEFPIYRYPSLYDPFICFTSGRDAGGRQDLVKSLDLQIAAALPKRGTGAEWFHVRQIQNPLFLSILGVIADP